MKIAVQQREAEFQGSFSRRWIDALRVLGDEVVVIDFRDIDAISQIAQCDGAMWHFMHTPDDKNAASKILSSVEVGLQIPVFPNWNTRWHFDEKMAQHYLFQTAGIPHVKSWVFWDREEAIQFAGKCAYPIVFKLSGGAASTNVLKLNSKREAVTMIRRAFGRTGLKPRACHLKMNMEQLMRIRMFAIIKVKRILGIKVAFPSDLYEPQKNCVYFQEFMPGNDHDIRITVIGNRAWGFVRHNRAGDFRASGSGKIDYDLAKVPIEAVRIAHDVSKRFGFQSMAYDFLRSSDGTLLINEISYGFVGSAVHECKGYWDRDLVWHEGQIWPEEAQIEDFRQKIAEHIGSKGNTEQ